MIALPIVMGMWSMSILLMVLCWVSKKPVSLDVWDMIALYYVIGAMLGPKKLSWVIYFILKVCGIWTTLQCCILNLEFFSPEVPNFVLHRSFGLSRDSVRGRNRGRSHHPQSHEVRIWTIGTHYMYIVPSRETVISTLYLNSSPSCLGSCEEVTKAVMHLLKVLSGYGNNNKIT